jgi:hypothetical protein
MDNMIEYMNIHLISLEQDLEIIKSKSDLTGAHYVKQAEIDLVKHLLEVSNEFN